MPEASARSWVTKTSVMPSARDQFNQQLDDGRLYHDIERRGDLVGDQKARSGGDGAGDGHPLPLPARELMGIGARQPLRLGQMHAGKKAHRLGVGGGAVEPKVAARALAHLLADGENRIEAGTGVLEDIADIAAGARSAA